MLPSKSMTVSGLSLSRKNVRFEWNEINAKNNTERKILSSYMTVKDNAATSINPQVLFDHRTVLLRE